MPRAYEIAMSLVDSEGIDGVRADQNTMIVSHAPEEPLVEKIPEHVHDTIMSAIDGTDWVPEYEYAGRNAERHSWSGGVTNDPILLSREQPEGYELQYRLVNSFNVS